MNTPDDICGICGQPGADKYAHPVRWPGEQAPEGELVHSECEDRECRRAHDAFWMRVGDAGVQEFLRTMP